MSTVGYVVLGKDNRLSFDSSPRRAGRTYGRTHAERTFDYAQLA